MSQRSRAGTQQTVSGGYPLLTVSQIGEIFNALNIPVETPDLNKPTAQTAFTVYASLLDVLMGAHQELVDNPRSALLGMMEYKVGQHIAQGRPLTGQELYSDALQFTIFYKHW